MMNATSHLLPSLLPAFSDLSHANSLRYCRADRRQVRVAGSSLSNHTLLSEPSHATQLDTRAHNVTWLSASRRLRTHGASGLAVGLSRSVLPQVCQSSLSTLRAPWSCRKPPMVSAPAVLHSPCSTGPPCRLASSSAAANGHPKVQPRVLNSEPLHQEGILGHRNLLIEPPRRPPYR